MIIHVVMKQLQSWQQKVGGKINFGIKIDKERRQNMRSPLDLCIPPPAVSTFHLLWVANVAATPTLHPACLTQKGMAKQHPSPLSPPQDQCIPAQPRTNQSALYHDTHGGSSCGVRWVWLHLFQIRLTVRDLCLHLMKDVQGNKIINTGAGGWAPWRVDCPGQDREELNTQRYGDLALIAVHKEGLYLHQLPPGRTHYTRNPSSSPLHPFFLSSA